MGPTLIAFRLADRPAQTEINASNLTDPISHLTFRRSTRRTNNNGPDFRTRVSTIRFGSLHREELAQDIHPHIEMEAQIDVVRGQAKNGRAESPERGISTELV